MATASKSTAEQSATLRHPPYTYIHLSLHKLPSPNEKYRFPELDAVTCLSSLRSALQSYLGLTGTAIIIDVLKTENENAWIRVPFEDGSAVIASVSQWSGMQDGAGVQLRVRASGTRLGGMATSENDMRLWTLEP